MLTGHVHTFSGAPVADASVRLDNGSAAVTAQNGSFSLQEPPGSYHVTVASKGYVAAAFVVGVDHDVAVDVTLEPLDAPTERTIATVTVDGRLTPVTGAIPTFSVSRADMERQGNDRIVDALMAIPSLTFARPDGGGANAITVVALRGPDPSESLDMLDGQTLNDGNTGDLDLSRFPVAAFQAVDVTEGLGPEDSNGSNTFGGSINLVSLRPTLTPHMAFSESAGSFGQSEYWLNATGTHDKLGYAVALDNQDEAGYVNQNVLLDGTTPTYLGSHVTSRSELANLTWNFSSRANVNARVFVLGDTRDQSSSINGIDLTSPTSPTYGDFIGPGVQSFDQTIRAYQVRAQSPLGAGELTTDLSTSDNTIAPDGNPSNPAYDVDHIDHRYNGGLTWERIFANSQFAVGGYTRYESLAFVDPVFATQSLGQTINVGFLRGGVQATSKLRLDGGVFASRYTTFGSNLDGRLAAVYDLDPRESLRFSIGTGFRAPLLIERYQFPVAELTQDALGVFIGQGNPGEHPEHATEYELGESFRFDSATLDVSLYRTNLRDPIEIYYPLELAEAGGCKNQTPLNVIPGCTSYNSNVGNAVYQGAELRFVQRFAPEHLFLNASYGLNIAYPKDLTADFSNPTSAANLVDNQQFPNIPQQQGSLGLEYERDTWHASAQADFRGNNNELNQGPFTVINASVGTKINEITDLTLAGTNVFNAAAGRFTQFGAGEPYIGLGGQPIPTNRYFIEPFGVRFILTLKH